MKLKKYILFIVTLCILAGVGYYLFRYYYLKSSEGNQHYNQQAIDKIIKTPTTGQLCFAVLGNNRGDGPVFSNVLASINSDPDIKFAVHTGCFTSQGYAYQYFDYLKSISTVSKEFVTAIGNKDAKHNGIEEYHKSFGKDYFDFNVGDINFIILNISETDGSSFTEEQKEWLVSALDKSQNSKFKFVFFNVPLFDASKFDFDPISSGRFLADADVNNSIGLRNKSLAFELANLFASKKVNYIFASHLSGVFEGKWASVPFMISGGAGAPLLNPNETNGYYNYLKVCVEGDTVQSKAVKMESPSLDNYAD